MGVNPVPAPTLIAATSNSLTLGQSAASGGTAPYTYQLQRSHDLSNWFSVGAPQTLADTVIPANVTDVNLPPYTPFYYQTVVTDVVSIVTGVHAQFTTHTGIGATAASEITRIIAIVDAAVGKNQSGVYATTTTALAHAVASGLEAQFQLVVTVIFQPDVEGSGGANLFIHGWPTAVVS